MEVFTEINIDLAKRKFPEQIHAMQLDANTRVVVVSLYDSGMPWDVPDGVSPSVAFRKSDGNGGWYSKLPDGTVACAVDGNEVTATLAPEVLTCAGKTEVAIVLQNTETLDQIASFPFDVIVTPNPAAGEDISNNYFEYKTMADVNEALVGFREEIRAFGVEIEEFSESLRPTKYSLTASGAAAEEWDSIRDLPTGRIYRIPGGSNHPPEGFGLPYKGQKQSTLVVIGSGDTSWCTMYICATRSGEVWFAYDDPNATGEVAWRPLDKRDIILTDTGSKEAPLNLGQYGIGSGSVVHFLPGVTYVVAPFDMSEISHVSFCLNGATVKCAGEYFLKANGCDHLRIEGGRIEGYVSGDENCARMAVELNGCKMSRISRMNIANIGWEETVGGKGIMLTGDCTGFLIDQCDFSNIRAGVVSNSTDDNWIHSFGIVVNRSQISEEYSRSGVIRSCTFTDIAGIDGVDAQNKPKKGDGDGIFIYSFPYYDSDGNLARTDPMILIEDCSFSNCKKRGVKAVSRGVTVRRCSFKGAFWFAPVEFQMGHGVLEDCVIFNESNHDGIVAGVVIDDGNTVVRDCYINCAYGVGQYHDGIMLGSREDKNPLTPDDPWEVVTVERCRFDGVEHALLAGSGAEGQRPGYHLRGIHVVDCRFGIFSEKFPVHISQGRFGSIDSIRMVDYLFELGSSKDDINNKIKSLTGTKGQFTFPIIYGMVPTGQLHIYSAHYLGPPTESNGARLPTGGAAPDAKIVYNNIDTIEYAERTAWQTRYYSAKKPVEISKVDEPKAYQLLEGARVGDVFTVTGTGDMYICIEAGVVGSGTEGEDGYVASSSGKWDKVSMEDQIDSKIGDMSQLQTESKESLVAAINEAARSGGGSVDEATVERIVEAYLEENPPEGGYTPVRGTDYWTEEDKAEIKSYVDEAILGGAW